MCRQINQLAVWQIHKISNHSTLVTEKVKGKPALINVQLERFMEIWNGGGCTNVVAKRERKVLSILHYLWQRSEDAAFPRRGCDQGAPPYFQCTYFTSPHFPAV